MPETVGEITNLTAVQVAAMLNELEASYKARKKKLNALHAVLIVEEAQDATTPEDNPSATDPS